MHKLRQLNESVLAPAFESQLKSAELRAGKLESNERLRELVNDLTPDPPPTYSSNERAWFVREQVRTAELSWPLHGDIQYTRRLFHKAAEAWMPAVEVMEFGKVYSSRCCTHRSKVAGRVESGEVKIIEKSKDRSGYVVIEERQEAFEIEPIPTREALMAAVMSGDWTLADRMARAYQLHPFDPRVPRSNNILAMLRDLIVGDDEAARQCLTKFTHKYPRDRASPVYREELMIGIIDRNEDLLREGLKQTNKRFDTVWNLKNYEKPRSLKQFDSVQSLHESCVRDLLRFRWAISIFAVAMMRIAVRRGLTALLNEPECWSDWVPFELVT